MDSGYAEQPYDSLPNPDNDPPFSRIFVVCSKTTTEDELKDAFQPFGKLQSVKILHDKTTNESKGLAYIKYEKTSSAHKAIESMNGKHLGDQQGPVLKVAIAEAKGSTRPKAVYGTDPEDTPARSRLFISIPRECPESEIAAAFSTYGNFEYVKLLKDRNTSESKGTGYIKFSSAVNATIAMEEIGNIGEIAGHKISKLAIAEPKNYRTQEAAGGATGYPGSGGHSSYGNSAFGYPGSFSGSFGGGGGFPSGAPDPRGYYGDFYGSQPSGGGGGGAGGGGGLIEGNRLYVVCHKSVTQEQLFQIFSRYPGIEYVDLKRDKNTGESRGFAYVGFSTLQSAIAAKDLDQTEFPPGSPLKVMFAEAPPRAAAGGGGGPQASAGPSAVSASASHASSKSQNYPEGSRIFLVLSKSLPDYILQDIFCRFGQLEFIRMQPYKHYGYVKYTTSEAAQYAIHYLNGQDIHGVRFKVSVAEPPSESRKRPRDN